MRASRCIALVQALAWLTGSAFVEPAQGTEVSPAPLEEVVVQAQRLHELRAAVVAAEDRFFTRYNELNPVDEFDIVCRQEQRTGTRMSRRVCVARVIDDATRAEALAMLEAMQQEGGRPRAEAASSVLTRKSPEYRANLLQLLRKHPELRALVQEQEQASQRYEAARKERLGDRIVLVE